MSYHHRVSDIQKRQKNCDDSININITINNSPNGLTDEPGDNTAVITLPQGQVTINPGSNIPFNNIVHNTIGVTTDSTGVITLPPGTYKFKFQILTQGSYTVIVLHGNNLSLPPSPATINNIDFSHTYTVTTTPINNTITIINTVTPIIASNQQTMNPGVLIITQQITG